eukprot:jgi/Tetstr1/438591/TSEL_027142.t1
MYPLSASLHPTSLAIVLELLFQHEVDPAELTKCGGAKAFGAHTASWRTLARVAVAGTDMPREVTYNASKSVSEQVYTAMLGDCLPAQSTIDKQYDGFRSVAVAISIYLDRVVTPCRARRMFDRDGYQSFELTPYGRHLFESSRSPATQLVGAIGPPLHLVSRQLSQPRHAARRRLRPPLHHVPRQLSQPGWLAPSGHRIPMCPVVFAARARSWSAPSGRHCTMCPSRFRGLPGTKPAGAIGPPLHDMCPGRFRGPGTQLVGDIGPPLQVPTRSLSQPAGTQLAGAIGSPLHHVPPVASVARARS